jgi:hypothetical protein
MAGDSSRVDDCIAMANIRETIRTLGVDRVRGF